MWWFKSVVRRSGPFLVPSVGVVAEAGAAAQHLAGQAVLVPRILPCGECSCCRRGAVLTCPHRRSRPSVPQPYEVLPARYLLPLHPPLSGSNTAVGFAVAVRGLGRCAAHAVRGPGSRWGVARNGLRGAGTWREVGACCGACRGSGAVCGAFFGQKMQRPFRSGKGAAASGRAGDCSGTASRRGLYHRDDR